VLKPRRGSVSSGVAFIESSDDIRYQELHRREWRGLLLENQIMTGSHPANLERLTDYISIETINTLQHQHIAVFDKIAISLVRRTGPDGADSIIETGSILPSRLPSDAMAEVLDYVSSCLTALGIRWRVTHTEVKLSPSGPEIIEVNGRTAGYLSRVIRLVAGADLVRAALSLAMGTPPSPMPEHLDGSVMLLMPTFPDRGSIVRSHVSRAELRSLPCVVGVDEVAVYNQPRDAYGHHMAIVVLQAPTVEEIDRAADGVLAAVGQLFAADLGQPD
jgi:hypothetical protein